LDRGAIETTGTIKGRIVDAQGLAIPGVAVTATGPQGGTTEVVQVQASSPVLDTSSTTTGAVLSSDQLNRVPVGRRISDALYLAPGVSSSGTAGAANPSIAGGTGLDNQYVVDGVNITNQGYGALGSYSIIFGSLGNCNATPFDFVKEFQVKTGGYEAEFGQSTGGVVNVLTKSGSNDFRGSVFGYARPSKVEGTWTQVQSINGTVQTLGTHVSDAGAEGGGPIVKDRAFFFGAIDPSWETRTLQAPAGFPLASRGGIDRDRRQCRIRQRGPCS
jgi:outer membrane receptor for ferrienterochelin and colicin